MNTMTITMPGAATPEAVKVNETTFIPESELTAARKTAARALQLLQERASYLPGDFKSLFLNSDLTGTVKELEDLSRGFA